MKKIMRNYIAVLIALAVILSGIFLPASEETYAFSKQPAKVTGISKSYLGSYVYRIRWKKAAGAGKYQVFRADSATGSLRRLKTTARLMVSVRVKPGKKAWFRVRAVNGGKKGKFSRIIRISTPPVPGKPTGLKRVYEGHYNYRLKWKKASKAKKYEVYRASSEKGKYVLSGKTVSAAFTAYVIPGKTKYYKVRGINGVTRGAFSKAIKVSTKKEAKLSSGIPVYWNEEIRNALKKYNKSEGNAGFLYFTDPHWGANTKHSPAIINYLYDLTGMSLAVCGGDIIAGTHEKSEDAIAEIESFYGSFDNSVNLMTTTGNHDYNTSSGDSAPLTDKKLYELIYQKAKTFANVAQYGRCAYMDDEANRIRYISLYFDSYLNNLIPQMGLDVESSYPSAQELAWLKETMQDDRLDQDWTVILFTHGYWDFRKKGETPVPTDAGRRLGRYLLTLQGDEDTEADIGCWMVGHTHRDKTSVISDENGSIRIICTNCDTYMDGNASRGSGYWGGWKMKKNHDTEQVIDMVRIDTENKKINLIRVGAGKNRQYSY